MSKTTTIDQILRLIRLGKTKRAILLLRERARTRATIRALDNLSNRLQRIIRDDRAGVLTEEQRGVAYNSINQQLVDLVDEIYSTPGKETPSNQTTRNRLFFPFMLVVTLVATYFISRVEIMGLNENSNHQLSAKKEIKDLKVMKPRRTDNGIEESGTEHKDPSVEQLTSGGEQVPLILNILVNSDFSKCRIFVDDKEIPLVNGSTLTIKRIELPALKKDYRIRLVNQSGKNCEELVKLDYANQRITACNN